MPLTSLQEQKLELSIIWVGGNPLPLEQLLNLIKIVIEHPDSTIKIWVDSAKTNEVLASQFKLSSLKDRIDSHPEIVNKIFKSTNLLNFVSDLITNEYDFFEIYKNFTFVRIDYETLLIPKNVQAILKETAESKLWAAKSDILRLFIVCRPLKEGAPQFRCYIEPDNIINPQLWNKLKSREITVYYNNDRPKEIAVLGAVLPDFIYINLTSEQSMQFATSIPTNMSKLLSDPIINIYLKEMFFVAKQRGGLHANDIMWSFGALVGSLFKMHFMRKEPEGLYGLEKYFFSIGDDMDEYRPHDATNIAMREMRSWERMGIKQIDGGMLAWLFSYRISFICDANDELCKKLLILSKVQSMEEFISILQDTFIKHYEGRVPAWFLETREAFLAASASTTLSSTLKPNP